MTHIYVKIRFFFVSGFIISSLCKITRSTVSRNEIVYEMHAILEKSHRLMEICDYIMETSFFLVHMFTH